MDLLPEVLVIDISEQKSSLIKKIEYCEDYKILTVYFRKYYTDHLSFADVHRNHFDEFLSQKSIGKYFLHFIKPNFKTMSTEQRKIKTKNQASNEKRFIKISIDVTKIIKDWIRAGEKGNYLNVTLQLLPDGQLDKYGNLGMVTQDVPKEIYEKEKKDGIQKKEMTVGPILGNGAEMDWGGNKTEGLPGQDNGAAISPEVIDDLPF